MKRNKELLFVQPAFPTPNKSINHSNFMPIGLLKLITYYREIGYYVDDSQLVRGSVDNLDFIPSKIFITTLFTYWFDYVKETILYYKNKFPNAEIHVGGILATLLPEKIEEIDKSIIIHQGINKNIERICYEKGAAYDVVDKYGVDYQIVHAMRGCRRKCKFCGTWRLENREDYNVNTVINYIKKCSKIGKNERRRIVFYDNNFLAHNDIEYLLESLCKIKVNGKPIICESQSGFDGRILLENPYLGKMIKKARFRRPKIAWDNSLNDYESIKKQIDIFTSSGYKNKEISVFMIYNWEYPFEVMLRKLKYCWEWQVQIADCRYRPLNSIYDNYNSHKWRIGQSEKDYYIHKSGGWTDKKIRLFRKMVRQQNIMIRQNWGPKQYEQWKNNEYISSIDDSRNRWPECFLDNV